MNIINGFEEDSSKFLSKEEELELGTKIQKYYKAQEVLDSGKRLSAKQREILEKEVKEGKIAVETLVKANMGLVYDRARAFKSSYPAGPDYEDLVQEGMAGLMVAVKKYDPERGNKFSTVAFSWISQSIGRGVNKTGRLVRLPENRIQDYSHMLKVINSLDTENLTSAEIDKIVMEKLNLSKKDLINIRAAASNHSSLNKTVGGDDSTKELIDFISEENTTLSSEQELVKKELNSALHKAIGGLDEVKKDIILSSFSLHPTKNMTVEQVRVKHQLQQFKLKKLQSEAMKELKENLTNNGFSLQDFVELD